MKPILFFLVTLTIAAFTCTVYADGFMNEYPNGNEVNDIVFQGDYAWSATYGSLVRWDKRDGTYIQFTTDNGLVYNNVTDLALGDDGRLWITTPRGVSVYDGQNFTTLTSENSGLMNDAVHCVTCSDDGVLWFGTLTGISKFNGDSWESISVDEIVPDHREEGYVSEIVIDHTGVVWAVWNYRYGILNARMYLSSYDGSTWTTHNGPDGSLKALNVDAIAVDHNNTLWAATSGSDIAGPLYTFDGTTWTNTCIEAVNDIDVAKDGTVYLARGDFRFPLKDDRYITKFDGTSFVDLPITGLLSSPVLAYMKIFADDHGTFWFSVSVGSAANILYSYDGVTVQQRSTIGPISYLANEMIVDSSNTKWLATSYGLSRFDGFEWKNIIFDAKPEDAQPGLDPAFALQWANDISDVAIDKEGTVWLATSLGIRKYDGNVGTVYNQWNTESIPGAISINNVAVDFNNVKWFANDSMLYRYDGETWSSFPLEKLEYTYFSSMEVDHDNVVWLGIAFAQMENVKNGVASFDGETWTYYDIDNSPLRGDLANIAIAEDNTKWIATSEGYYSFDGTTWTSYEDAKNKSYYPGMQPNDIFIDNDGTVWFMVSGYLHSFDGTVWDDHGKMKFGSVMGTQFVIDQSDEVWIVSMTGTGFIGSFNKNAIKTEVAEGDEIPATLAITGNYPNPFNPSTTIEFTVARAGLAQLDIYNIAGQKVRTLLNDTMTAGTHSLVWNGRDDYGRALSSGVYFSRITLSGQSATKRMLLMK